MRILIAPDKFKHSLTAAEAARAMAEGVRRADPSAEIDLCPMADGGEGTLDALLAARGGKRFEFEVTGPLPRMKVIAPVGILDDGFTAVIEMSTASGLQLLKPADRDPTRTTTYGTGELIAHAIALGARTIILGIGGSATIDGGIGAAQACGAEFTLIDGKHYSVGARRLTGGDLSRLRSIERPASIASSVRIQVACDVGNPLLGRDGAAAIFGPQKGASPEQIDSLEAGLTKLVEKTNRNDLADRPGSGAAGGLGFGLLTFFTAELLPGISVIMNATRFRERLASADLCLTGEGKLDAQSLGGKTAIGVAHLCREQNVPCIALAGVVELTSEQLQQSELTAAFAISPGPQSVEEAIRMTAENLSRSAEQVMRIQAR